MIRKFFHWIRNHFGTILIFSGCLVITTAVSMKLYTAYRQNALVTNYRNQMVGLNHSSVSSGQESGNQQKTAGARPDSKNSNNVMGILHIPKIDLTVGIQEGVGKETLKYSVGHFIGTAQPGRIGNFCLAGHRSYTYGEYFNRLNEVGKNDLILIDSGGKTYHYQVTETEVVEPEEVSVLNQTKDSEITLVTCTPIRSGTHRLIVKGVLVSNPKN